MPGHVERVSFNAFRDGRQCWVYLPPGYATSASSYPVLYLNDGAIAFDGPNAMHVNRICEDLIRRREIPPIIVVAIDQVSGSQRNFDYTPWPYQYWDEPNGGGDAYVRAVRDTLKPEIDRRYRTLGDHTNTAMAGMSLGGLVAAYAGYAYDSTFGRVAAFSPTYGYGNFGIYYFAQARGKPPLLERFYQDTGYPDDNWINYMTRLALEQGFVPGMDFMSVTVEGAGHGAKAWEHRFPDMLRFLYKR